MSSKYLQAQRKTASSGCWVLDVAGCEGVRTCDRCSTIRKALRAAAWVKSNWVDIQDGSFSGPNGRR